MYYHSKGLFFYVDLVRNCLKHEVFGTYYDFVNMCIVSRNDANTAREKNRFRLLRLICLLCFDENDYSYTPISLLEWKRIVRAYYRYLHC